MNTPDRTITGIAGNSAADPDAIKAAIRIEARRLGFDDTGVASAAADPADALHLQQYLDEGRHGTMAWMATTADRRADPQALWPAARSVVCCAMNYGPADDPLSALDQPDRGSISVYARGRDYHDVVKTRLKALGRFIVARFGGEVKVFVDTAPVMEKPLAQRAGLGWIGKHTNLVSRRFGSWLFLGEVFTTLDLPADQPETDHCGSCDRCRQACPTAALPEPYRIEPRRCLSYLTIEHKGDLPADLAALMGNRIYGCDDCLAACPWNSFATPTLHPEFAPRPATTAPSLEEVLMLDDPGFRARFAGTAVKRVGVERLRRNARSAASKPGMDATDSGARRNQPPLYIPKGVDDLRLSQNHPVVDLAPECDPSALDHGRGVVARGCDYFAARTLASWLNASRWRSLGIWVKLRASSRHIRWRTDRSSSVELPSRPSKK